MTDDASYKDFLLSAMRSASLRCKLMDNELATIGIALRGGLMSANDAAQALRDQSLMFLIGERAEIISITAADAGSVGDEA